jgi:hypothetical protein
VSVWNGVRVEDVYFDVTTEVTGRSSAMAAATAVTATFP